MLRETLLLILYDVNAHSIYCIRGEGGTEERADLYYDKTDEKDNKLFYKLHQTFNKSPSTFTKWLFHAAAAKSCRGVTQRLLSLTKNLKPSSEFPLACQPKCNRIFPGASIWDVNIILQFCPHFPLFAIEVFLCLLRGHHI